MRICLLSDGYLPWDQGGAQKIASQLAEEYADRGHDVAVLSTVSDPADAGRAVVDGVAVWLTYTPRPEDLLPSLTVQNPFVLGDCERLIDRFDPDVVHAHNVHWLSNESLRIAAEHAPVVKTFHDAGTFAYGDFTTPVERTPVGESVSKAAYCADPPRQRAEQGRRYFPPRNERNRRAVTQHVDVGVGVSDALRRALAANDVPCHLTVHNGVSLPEQSVPDGGVADSRTDSLAARADTETAGDRAEARLRRAYDLGDAPFVLFGGRTGYEKGGTHLATAFSAVCEALDEPVNLLVTGDSSFVERMQALAAPHGDQITPTGWLSRERLGVAFEAARVVATPSVYLDPFPTVNLEAFAAGTPVVTTRFGGGSELVDDGVDGAVVDPRDTEALATALAQFLANPDYAARCGAAGRRKVAREFTLRETVDTYLDLLALVA